jgi:pyruvate formate lyase activating enzyme
MKPCPKTRCAAIFVTTGAGSARANGGFAGSGKTGREGFTRSYAEGELREIARFVKSVGCAVPWHVTAFYPAYQLTDRPSTPVATLRRAREIGMEEGLRYVYEGNVPGEAGENTYCYGCGAVVIERSGFGFIRNRLQDGKCSECGKTIDGVGM